MASDNKLVLFHSPRNFDIIFEGEEWRKTFCERACLLQAVLPGELKHKFTGDCPPASHVCNASVRAFDDDTLFRQNIRERSAAFLGNGYCNRHTLGNASNIFGSLVRPSIGCNWLTNRRRLRLLARLGLSSDCSQSPDEHPRAAVGHEGGVRRPEFPWGRQVHGSYFIGSFLFHRSLLCGTVSSLT